MLREIGISQSACINGSIRRKFRKVLLLGTAYWSSTYSIVYLEVVSLYLIMLPRYHLVKGQVSFAHVAELGTPIPTAMKLASEPIP